MNPAYQTTVTRLFRLTLTSLVIFIIAYSDITVEKIYSDTLYPIISGIQRFISGLFPFAIGDFLYLLIILYVLRCVFVFYKKLRDKSLAKSEKIKIPLQVLNFLLLLYILFKILWGLNYSRPSVSTRLKLDNDKYTTVELVALGKLFVKKLNSLQQVQKSRYSVRQLESKAKAGYDSMAKSNALFKYTNPNVKSVTNSWIITKIGIEGYYNPLSGEANLNTRIPAVNLPFVTCHEIAHQLGIGREDEANLLGYLVASHSTDLNFQYSATYAMLKDILFEIRIKSPEEYDILYNSINPGSIRDLKNDRAFWRSYDSQLFGYLDASFDTFLKLNNQFRGTDSYQDIVLWLYNIHKKDL